MGGDDALLSQKILDHIHGLLFDANPPLLPQELADNKKMQDLQVYLLELRHLLQNHVEGDFSKEIHIRGILAGRLKAFQANVLHFIWQVEQVAKGDFSQRIDFMGDLATSFNTMILQLNEALTDLRKKEEELTSLTSMLEHEVELRGEALKELSASESRFRYLAEHDPLTGVLNRRSFFELAEIQLERTYRVKQDCCLAILDIDRFKSFNDTYGHVEGDAAIRHITRICSETLRKDDSMGRYGGEEFVFFFNNADCEHGIMAGERIRERIAETPFIMKGKQVKLTASIGLVHLPPEQIILHDSRFLPFALGIADNALYNAKKSGRNLVRTEILPPFEV